MLTGQDEVCLFSSRKKKGKKNDTRVKKSDKVGENPQFKSQRKAKKLQDLSNKKLLSAN